MGRPTASVTNKSISIAFARAITKITMCPDDAVARCGKCNIFSLLRQALPSIVREDGVGNREGVSEVEFNKTLQVSGFTRARNRKVGAANQRDDPLGAGLYLFTGVQWLDPDCPEDSMQLTANVISFNSIFGSYGCSLQLDSLQSHLRRVIDLWQQNQSSIESRRRRSRPKSRCSAKKPFCAKKLGQSSNPIGACSNAFVLTPKVEINVASESLRSFQHTNTHANDCHHQNKFGYLERSDQLSEDSAAPRNVAYISFHWSRSCPSTNGQLPVSGPAPTESTFSQTLNNALSEPASSSGSLECMRAGQTEAQARWSVASWGTCHPAQAYQVAWDAQCFPAWAGDEAYIMDAPVWSVLEDLPACDASTGWANFEGLLPVILREEGL